MNAMNQPQGPQTDARHAAISFTGDTMDAVRDVPFAVWPGRAAARW